MPLHFPEDDFLMMTSSQCFWST